VQPAVKSAIVALSAAGVLGACATVPRGPSVMVLPGAGKSFEQFQADDATCRLYAEQQTGISPGRSAARTTISGAAIGTAVGAAAGAAIGAAAGNPGAGAAIGAGGGLLTGSAVGAGQAEASSGSVQRRYDITYMQCMYAKGNQIPVARGSQPAYTSQPAYSAPPATVPPPPAGTPPPPPPGPAR